jgi:hypothetical protein
MYDCQILVCATAKELPWINCCMRSVKKFWKGSISPIVVLTPECRSMLPSILKDLQAYVVFQPEELHDYIRLTADSYLCAPLVLFLDTHEMFIRPCDLQTFTDPKRRPTVTTEAYTDTLSRPCADNNCIQNRRWSCDELLGMLPEFEYTGRDPMVFHRHSIRRVREMIESKNRRPIADLIRNYYPPYFSSTSLLGEYCHEKERSSYDWVDSNEPYEAAIQPFWGVRDATKGEDFDAVQKILVE